MPILLRQILAATKVTEITPIIEAFQDEFTVHWNAVGGNENNLATVNLGSDPAAGLVERITNAIDAVLERTWLEKGSPSHLLSPRSAVAGWFQIPDGHLYNIEDARDPRIVALNEKVAVTLRDSELPDRPTVDIRDQGIGIASEEIGSSILSLHGNRKLRKLFLAGAFGQGGSTAISYSQYTVIVSRKVHAPGEQPHPVTVTIVRFNRGNVNIDKHGMYEYMVNHATGHPFTFDLPLEEFTPGTLVRHVSMDLGKYKSLMTAQTGSLWWLAHNYLFDPVLPFWIEEQRTNSSQGQGRTVTGNARLLTQGFHREDGNVEYMRTAPLTFRSGSVTVTWWVLTAEGENARNRITGYALPSQPIIITYNGQKQGQLPNTIIKNDLRLPYLERYLIVHVDCDRLDNESRRQLFPTTRESLRDTSLVEDLRRLVIDTLAGDDELKRLDQERKRRYTQRVDSESVENIRRRLANRVRTTVLAGAGGRSPRVIPPEPRPPQPPPPPIPVQEPPTLLQITSPSPRRVYAGKRFTLSFQTDADPALFLNPDSFVAVIDPPSFGQYTGTTNIRSGYGTAYFTASENLDVGAQARITIEVRPRRSPSLRDSIDAEVIALPTEAGGGPGQVPTPNINPMWVAQGDPFWVERGWNENSVAAVGHDEESYDIYVSSDNRLLNGLITRAQRRDTAAVDSIRDFYLEHISYHALLNHLDQEQVIQANGEGTEPADPEAVERLREGELRRACATLVGIMENLFEVLVTRSEEPGEDVSLSVAGAADGAAIGESS